MNGQGWSQPLTWRQRRRSGERSRSDLVPYLETEEVIRAEVKAGPSLLPEDSVGDQVRGQGWSQSHS